MTITAPTPDQVKAINNSQIDGASIQPFIDAAMCIVNQVEMCMIGKGLSSDCQTSVATWLTAHLMANTGIDDKSRVKKRETFENYTVEWAQSQVQGSGIMSTTYGQMANTLSGGCLEENDRPTAFLGIFGGA